MATGGEAMSRFLRCAVRPAVAGALVCALGACGDDSPRPPVVVVTPQPVRGVIAQTSFSGFDEGLWVSIDVVLSQRGKLDVTVDWHYASTWMYVYLGNVKCDYTQLSENKCPFMISSETKDPKPRVLRTENLDPGTYYLVLYNVPYSWWTGIGSNNQETVSIEIGLTVGAEGQRSTEPVRLGSPKVIAPPRL
jgi:hypothetical protein